MAEFEPSSSVKEENEENLIAAAINIVKAFESHKKLTGDTTKILRDLSARLYDVSVVESEDKEATIEIKEALNKSEDAIMKWEVDKSAIIWDSGLDQAHEYLNAVDSSRKLIGRLQRLNLYEEDEVILKKGHELVKIGMLRLEREFRNLIVRNRVPFEPKRTSFSDDSVDFRSSFGDDNVDYFRSSFRDDDIVDNNVALMNQDVIPWLKSIAKVMFDSDYGRECLRAYVSARKVSHDDCLCILEVEKYWIDDVLKMEWNTLNSKIRNWIRAVENFVVVYLISEKRLCDDIFQDLGTASDCFLESTKAPLLHLLKSCNIEKLIRIQDPDKLIQIIEIYEVIADIVRDISLLYSETTSIQVETQDILKNLRDCVKATIFKFENAVATARKPTNHIPSNPGISYLSKYVMDYLKSLSSHTKTLDTVLMNGDIREEENPVSLQFFKSLILILETNLEDKSKLYENDALRYLFLMNNVHYMVHKVATSQVLRNSLGDGWISDRKRKFQEHAMSYIRASWSSILTLINPPAGLNSIPNRSYADRLQRFYLGFEEVYRLQTGWIVPDTKLRKDLKRSTSNKVVQAYREFVDRSFLYDSSSLRKNIKIKYSVEELENLLLDLLEGSPKSL